MSLTRAKLCLLFYAIIFVQIKPDWVISCQGGFLNRIQMKLYFFLSLPIVNNTMYYCRKKISTYN